MKYKKILGGILISSVILSIAPWILMILFYIMRVKESTVNKYLEGKYLKSGSYFLLGALTFLNHYAPDPIDISFYVAALCFIETIDLYFEHKNYKKMK